MSAWSSTAAPTPTRTSASVSPAPRWAMLDEGAGDFSAADLSREAQRLGASLSSGASADGASVGLSTLKRTLPESLDLLRTWSSSPPLTGRTGRSCARSASRASRRASRTRAASLAVMSNLLFGDAYKGRMTTEAGLTAIKTPHLKAWYRDNVALDHHPVGGWDTTLDEVLPCSKSASALERKPSQPSARHADRPHRQAGTIYFIDVPGAAQSVVRAGLFVCDELDEDWFAFDLANRAFGGLHRPAQQPPRTRASPTALEAVWATPTSRTVERLEQHRHRQHHPRRDRAAARDRRDARRPPITAEELDNARGGLLGTWPLNFENPGYLLSQTNQQVLYGLGGLRSSRCRVMRRSRWTLPRGLLQAPLHRRPRFVVGDAERCRSDLAEQTGWPIINLDVDGNVID